MVYGAMDQPVFFNPKRQQLYLTHSILGEGGFGRVYDGWCGALPVAIKVVKPTANSRQDWLTWDHEQRVHLRCIGHAFIVQTYDQFVALSGELIIVMERANGHLQTTIELGLRQSPKTVCKIACEILSALDFLHSCQVIHRDVTLKNILRFPQGVKLGDFGISRIQVDVNDLAKTFVGHPSYIPPELLRDGTRYSNFQSDLYQLGIVLLSLLTGKPPIPLNLTFDQASPFILDATPRRTAESLIPQYGRTAQMISRLLPRTLELRYQTAAQAYQDFHTEFKKLDQQENMAVAGLSLAALAALAMKA
jgi:serine/threonine protein kinase